MATIAGRVSRFGVNLHELIIPPLKTLLRGEPEVLADELRQPVTLRRVLPMLVAIVLGCGAYGTAIGLWRAPMQGLYVGVKMPLLIFLTLLVNGLINGMLAQVLGSGLSFRQTWTAFLKCFAIFGMIVGSLSPIVIAMVLDAPSPGQPEAREWYRLFLLLHTVVIAAAGIVANYKLLRMIQVFAGHAATGWRTLLAWLAGNLFVGAQLSYTLRPFFGDPKLPVQFLRDDPMKGSFYESVWGMARAAFGDVFQGSSPATVFLTSGIALLILLAALQWMVMHRKSTQPR